MESSSRPRGNPVAAGRAGVASPRAGAKKSSRTSHLQEADFRHRKAVAVGWPGVLQLGAGLSAKSDFFWRQQRFDQPTNDDSPIPLRLWTPFLGGRTSVADQFSGKLH